MGSSAISLPRSDADEAATTTHPDTSPTPSTSNSDEAALEALPQASPGSGSMKRTNSDDMYDDDMDDSMAHAVPLRGLGHTRRSFVRASSKDELNTSDCSPWDIIPHNSSFRLWWDQIVFILILYTVITIPLDIAFDPMPRAAAFWMDVFVTAGFAANILVNFRTSVERTQYVIMEPRRIARIYLRKWFWLDAVATVPWDLIFLSLLDEKGNALSSFRLLRLFRLSRLLSGKKFSLAYTQATLRLVRLLAYTLTIAHWLGCIWYMVCDYEEPTLAATSSEGLGFGDRFTSGVCQGPTDYYERSLAYQYFFALWFGVWSLFSMGSEIEPVTELQIALAITITLAGVTVFATAIGSIEVMLAQSAAASMRFAEHVAGLQDFFRHHKLPNRLRAHVLRHVHHAYRTQRGLDEHELFSVLPSEMQALMYRKLYKEDLLKCNFFEFSDEAFIDALCPYVQPQIALAGDIIIRQDAISSEMYIIKQGEAEAVDLITEEVHSHIPEGRFFGEIGLFTNSQRSISVRAKTYMELFVLTKQDFLKVLEYFPQEERRFIAIAKERVGKTEAVVKDLGRRIMKESGGADKAWDVNTVKDMLSNNKELAEVLAVEDPETLVALYDTNGDGVIDPAEQAHLLNYLKARASRLNTLSEAERVGRVPRANRRRSIEELSSRHYAQSMSNMTNSEDMQSAVMSAFEGGPVAERLETIEETIKKLQRNIEAIPRMLEAHVEAVDERRSPPTLGKSPSGRAPMRRAQSSRRPSTRPKRAGTHEPRAVDRQALRAERERLQRGSSSDLLEPDADPPSVSMSISTTSPATQDRRVSRYGRSDRRRRGGGARSRSRSREPRRRRGRNGGGDSEVRWDLHGRRYTERAEDAYEEEPADDPVDSGQQRE